jgi:hypothetical protein
MRIIVAEGPVRKPTVLAADEEEPDQVVCDDGKAAAGDAAPVIQERFSPFADSLKPLRTRISTTTVIT